MRWIVAMCVGCLLAGAARAAPPPNADPRLAPWFDSLRQPDSDAPCCSTADCRMVPSRLRSGHYEVFIDKAWRVVPDDVILNRTDNPTGRAVACWTPDDELLCFVPSPQS